MRLILVVDDSSEALEMMLRILRRENYQTAGAANGKLALEFLRTASELPRLIVLDLMMPVMNGWEFMVEKMADSRLQTIPVIVCSAVEPGGLGAVEFIAKPIVGKDLLDKVKQILLLNAQP